MSRRVTQKQSARVVRDQLAKEQRLRRTLWTAIVAVGVILIAGLIGWGLYASNRSGDYVAPEHASSDGTGVKVGSGPVTVDIFIDFMCPHCKTFEAEAADTLRKLAAENKATLVYHPMSILDRASTNEYSTRSSASSGCAANADKFTEYAAALFARQPAEGGPGLTDDELIQVAGGVGIVDPAFAQCVRDGTYRSWTRHVTDGAGKKGVDSTPTVLVNGKKVEASSAAIVTAVDAAAK